MTDKKKDLGHYEGRFVGEFIGERLVKLVEPFSYIDPFTMRWDVPKGWKVDGASIPPILWFPVGSPFTGLYRHASVIHDYYCDTKQRPWGAVHRVFYDAMLTSKVNPMRAKLMYAAVCWGGPRWSVQIVNTYQDAFQEYLKSSREGSNRVHFPMLGPELDDISKYDRAITKEYRFAITTDDLKVLEREVQTGDISPDYIPEFVEEKIEKRGLASI